MASTGREHQGSDPEAPGVSEPITLTDPDGAVTRVAPWSSWTREQVRRPGGESALVTRIDQGKLWFSSGRRKSPWLHEVHVGPAVVSTPGGRFQVTVEADGGASVACLAGRTRVASGLEGPVVLATDQSAAVSSDGLTLVVLDRPHAEDVDIEDPLEQAGTDDEQPRRPASGLAAASSVDEEPARRRWWWLPELVAAAAVLAVIIGAIALFIGPSSEGEIAAPTTGSTMPISTTEPPDVTTSSKVPTTTASSTTTASTTTASTTTSSTLRSVSPGATGVGVLQSCRRTPDGVQATVRVRHQAGDPSRFEVTVAAVDRSDAVLARGSATTEALEPAAVGSIDVFIPLDGRAASSCLVLGVASV